MGSYGIYDTQDEPILEWRGGDKTSVDSELGHSTSEARVLPMVSLVFVYTPLTEIRLDESN